MPFLRPFTYHIPFEAVCTAQQLPEVLQLAVSLSGHADMFTRDYRTVSPAYQMPDSRHIGIAAGSMAPGGQYPDGLGAAEGWTDMDVPYSPENLANEIIKRLMRNQGSFEDADSPANNNLIKVRSYNQFVRSGITKLVSFQNPDECFLVCETASRLNLPPVIC